MNKSDIIDLVAQSTKTKKEAGELVDGIFNAMKKALEGGDKVQIAGFGTFSVKERQARTGRNPQTGETINIPAKKVAKFKAAKDLI